MSHSAPPADWQRLGELLTRRRVELDKRYRNRTLFATERGLNYRLAYDIEEAKRTNFSPAALALIASAYAVTPASMDDALAGGELVPVAPAEAPPLPEAGAPGPAGDALAAGGLEPDDEGDPDVQMLRAVVALANMTGTPPADRIEMIRGLFRRARPEPGSGSGRRTHTG